MRSDLPQFHSADCGKGRNEDQDVYGGHCKRAPLQGKGDGTPFE